jgi:hypothetical protein
MSEIKSFFRFSITDARSFALLAIVLAAALGLFNHMGNSDARQWDIAWGYWANLAVFVALLGGLAWNMKEIIQRLRGNLPTKRGLALTSLVILFFIWFATSYTHVQHRVLSDENSWESMAIQMRDHQSGGVCNQGVWENGTLVCHEEVNNFKGKAFSFLQSLVFRWAEPTRDTALLLNLPLAALSLLFFFYALFRWSKNEWTALAGMLFLATMPIYILQARSASTEVLYIFLLTAVLAWYALVPAAEVSWKHFALTIPLLGFFAQTRQETIFCFIPFALYYHSYLRAKPWRLAAFTGATLLASWPSINTMAAYRGYDFQGGTHAAHSFDNFWYNVKSNIGIMLNSGVSSDGLLNNPFYTTYTVLLLGAAAWLLVRLLFNGKFAWAALLVFTFSVQIFVILYNVSGTFEIDINQRYVLVALPLFAAIMAVGLKDFIEKIAPDNSAVSFAAPLATAVVAALLALSLSFKHVPSFEANILYRKNMLLTEEDFLNAELAKIPPQAIYIYARPWQILCMGHNAFSEQTFLNWSPQEFAKWYAWSGGHIYVIRGQDGYGQVDRNSRVVGFKTTGTIERILEQFQNTRIFSQSRPFGYPLTMHQLHGRKGVSRFSQGLSMQSYSYTPDAGSALPLVLRKNVADTLAYQIVLDGVLVRNDTLASPVDTVNLPATQLRPGMHTLQATFFAPENDTVRITQQLFARHAGNALLQDQSPETYTQSWGEPQQGKSVEQHTLRIDGREFPFGVGSHAPSTLVYNIAGKYKQLHSWIGLDDEAACGDGVVWVVKGDGRELHRSRNLASHEIDSLSVDISSVQRLELITLEQGDMNCDHANWAGAWFE